MTKRDEVLAAALKLRSVPVATVEALRLLHDPEAGVERVVQAIERDPGWTANLLRVANSAYFGCPRTVGSAREAFVRLGTRNVFQLIVGAAVVPILRGYVLDGHGRRIALWQHSLAVAAGMDRIAKAAKMDPPDYAYTGAVLHDIGKVVLRQTVPAMETVDELATHQKLPAELAERLVLGVDHAEVGALVLGRWNVPDGIVSLVGKHHGASEPADLTPAVQLVRLADMAACIAERRANANDEFVNQFLESAGQALGLREHEAVSITDGIRQLHVQAEDSTLQRELVEVQDHGI